MEEQEQHEGDVTQPVETPKEPVAIGAFEIKIKVTSYDDNSQNIIVECPPNMSLVDKMGFMAIASRIVGKDYF